MMKSSFMLYILCMKVSDPETRCYCTRERASAGEEEMLSRSFSGRELTFFMDTDSNRNPGNRDIPGVCRLHRVKLTAGKLRGGGG